MADKPKAPGKPTLALTAGTVAVTATKTHNGVTATLTGSTPGTEVVFQFGMPEGGITEVPATTDGSGDATASVTPSVPGTITCQVVAIQAPFVVGPEQSAYVS